MSLEFTFLSQDRFDQIHAAFVRAFSDYHVDVSYMTPEVLGKRAIKNGVAYESSVGIFDGPDLVAFTLVGLDAWEGRPAAFDIATGIVPDYRGRGLAGRIFEFALPALARRRIERFILEVLEVNGAAIRAYEKAGFSKARKVDCFQLAAGSSMDAGATASDVTIEPSDRRILEELAGEMDWQPSWENSLSSIRRIPDELIVLGAYHRNRCVAEITYYPTLGWIMSLVVARPHRGSGIASSLIRRVKEIAARGKTGLKALNVDEGDRAMHSCLWRAGFEIYARQYEMHRPI
jgi:ribosomal protein S18 acetylase RimI-like enzyme